MEANPERASPPQDHELSHVRTGKARQTPVLLEARDLTKRYGQNIALDSVEFQVSEGITGLLGPNGAGKSTAIKLFLGLLKPTSGSAEVMGVNSYESVDVRARLGYMPEHDCLPTATAASEFLTHMAQVSRLPPSHARTRAADILRHVRLGEERYRKMGEYSTGMKQRVKLAQALVHDPVLVLLDEPTAGLDPGGREEMLELIRRTGREFGISIVLSSHLMADVESTCDRVIVLDAGHVVEEGTVSQFTRETEALLIDVDDHRDELVAALAKRSIHAVDEGASLVVELKAEEQYDVVRDALVEAGARLRRLAPRRHRLADIFRSPPQ
jgi:ABC-2 type transport system ATP-binding protein